MQHTAGPAGEDEAENDAFCQPLEPETKVVSEVLEETFGNEVPRVLARLPKRKPWIRVSSHEAEELSRIAARDPGTTHPQTCLERLCVEHVLPRSRFEVNLPTPPEALLDAAELKEWQDAPMFDPRHRMLDRGPWNREPELAGLWWLGPAGPG